MDHYIVSARKYRPSTFSTVIGQRSLTAALKHAIATERLAHAYLFCGSRGVGKTSCARIFAKTINCVHRTPDGEACNECESCRAFNQGTSFNIIELDAASHNGVDDIKSLIEQVMVPPTLGRYRVFIIDEVHMLSSQAFNAFLKTLEEPPEHAIFVLATTEKHKIIPTILSRCQIYDFSRITVADMVHHLANVAQQEGIEAETAALGVIAQKADGAMRDALSIFDQVAASSMGHVTYQNAIDNLNILDSSYYGRLIEAFLTGNVPESLIIYKQVRDRGFDSQFFINGLGLYLRDLMLATQPSTLELLEADEQSRQQMAQIAAKCSPPFIYKAMDLCNDADLNFRAATNKQFLIELTLVKLCQLCSPSPNKNGVGEGQLKPIAVATSPVQPYVPTPAPTQTPAPNAAVPAPDQPSMPRVASISTPAPAPSRPTIKKGISLSIKGKHSIGNAASSPGQTTTVTKRQQSYTEEELLLAWKAYAEAHPTERILVSTMMTCQPIKNDMDKYSIIVDDNIQVEAINEAKPQILQWLGDQLQNDNIDFQVEVNQGESSPIGWNQRQVLEHLMSNNKALCEMIKDYGFILA